MKTLTGAAAHDMIRDQLNGHFGCIAKSLTRFDPVSMFETWFDCYRAIEELINLPAFGIDDSGLRNALIGMPLDARTSKRLAAMRRHIERRYGTAFFERLAALLMQAPAIRGALTMHGFPEPAAGFNTVGHMCGYMQSRRRHLAALLYALPRACKGADRMEPAEALLHMVPLVEAYGMNAVTQQYNLALAAIDPALEIYVYGNGFHASRHLNPLEGFWLEPERVGILDTLDDVDHAAVAAALEPLDRCLLFSRAEIRNNIVSIEAAYNEFGLADGRFAPMAAFVRGALDHCADEWRIDMTPAQFEEIADRCGLDAAMRARLVARCPDYAAGLEATEPLIDLGDQLTSSVTLLSRFLYYWKSECLNQNRRFQIRSGFIFESEIRKRLEKQGFELTAIKRIERKEFDVVAILEGVVHNFQCKNNFMDIERLATDPERYARANRTLARYYGRALVKERNREGLLRAATGIDDVRHWVISRFPVVTDDPTVIPFNRIGTAAERCIASTATKCERHTYVVEEPEI